jgi:hypothetical protein
MCVEEVSCMTGTVTDVKAYQCYAGRRWRDVTSGTLFDDGEPCTANVSARVADCGAEEARLPISAAHEAFHPWAHLRPAEKARLSLKAAEVVGDRRSGIAEMLARKTASNRCLLDLPARLGYLDLGAGRQLGMPAQRRGVAVELGQLLLDRRAMSFGSGRIGAQDPARQRQPELSDSD